VASGAEASLVPTPLPPDRQRGQYLHIRVNSTKFSGQSGNRIGIIGRGLPEHTLVFAHCPLTSHTPVSWVFFKALLSPDHSPTILNHTWGGGRKRWRPAQVLSPHGVRWPCGGLCILFISAAARPPICPLDYDLARVLACSQSAQSASPGCFSQPLSPPWAPPPCRRAVHRGVHVHGGRLQPRPPLHAAVLRPHPPAQHGECAGPLSHPPYPITIPPKGNITFCRGSPPIERIGQASGFGPHLLPETNAVVSHVCRIAGGNS